MGFKGGMRVNRTLISLKVVVFLVLSGLTALHLLHTMVPVHLGLSFAEHRTISIVAAFVSILGPLIAGPWADRLAAKNPNGFGRTLRQLTAFCLLITLLIYSSLLFIPKLERPIDEQPQVSFACDGNGAYIYQKLCNENISTTCPTWERKTGRLNLTRCSYSCLDPNHHEDMYQFWLGELPTAAPSSEVSGEYDYEEEAASTAITERMRTRRQLEEAPGDSAGAEQQSAESSRLSVRQVKKAPKKVYVEPPHLCVTENKLVTSCHVYTSDTPSIVMDTVMGPVMDVNKTDKTQGWCQYPLEGIQCNIPDQQVDYMRGLRGKNCQPIIECLVYNPYNDSDSVLEDTACIEKTGTIMKYTIVRILGDILAMAALTLLNTAIVIAVRETSEGRGEVCRQYVWGAIGYVLLFSPLLDLFRWPQHDDDSYAELAPGITILFLIVIFIVFFGIGALVLLCASQMPLSPPEWWWHTKTGMLVVPMSAIRKYSPEIAVLTVVSIIFGTFWSSIHTYLNWTYIDSYAIIVAALLLILALFFNVDRFIEYCGHSNIFITGFALFVIRFAALSDAGANWLTITMECIEPALIGVLWITIILYMRHSMPRKLTATGQAIAVLSFFGLGKGFGALIGLLREEHRPALEYWKCTYEYLAIAAFIISLVYFVAYHLILAPRCTAKPQHSEELISGSASQNFGQNGAGYAGNGAGNGAGGGAVGSGAGASLNGGNANGSYSPLRVYHNERGKKGQFRY